MASLPKHWMIESPDDYLASLRDRLYPDRVERLNGDILVSRAPSPEHQDAAFWLAHWIGSWGRQGSLARVWTAPVAVRLSTDPDSTADDVEPDVVVRCNDNPQCRFVPTTSVRGGWIEGPPDLVVEVLSPSTRKRDLGPKMRAYAAAGVPDYWALDREGHRARVFASPIRKEYTTIEDVAWADLALPWAPDERWGSYPLFPEPEPPVIVTGGKVARRRP